MPTASDAWAAWLEQSKSRYIDGDVEHIEDPEGCFRGPITSIEITGNALVIKTKWTGHIETNRHGMPMGEWSAANVPDPTTFTYDLSVMGQPNDIGQGRTFFTYPFSRITLFPKGGSKLDKSKVRGV